MASSQFRNLVFEGGGVKGIAYAGAIQVLEQNKILPDIIRVAGTSAGAITATLLALGAGSKDIADIVGGTDFRQFMDSSLLPTSNIWRLVNDYGWYKGDAFAAWMQGIIKQRTGDAGTTFAQLRALSAPDVKGGGAFRDLYMVGTDLSRQQALTFSGDDTPDLPIWYAARTSMSIPFFFQAVMAQGDVRVDGGVSWNYPIDMFDDRRFLDDTKKGVKPGYPTLYSANQVFNKETLGFRVDTADEIAAEKQRWRSPPDKVANIEDYIKALVGFMVDTANKTHLHDDDWHRTVFIDAAGISATDFGLSPAQIKTLIANGVQGTTAYLKWFTNAKAKPLNR